jgi:DNA-binding response OmpR family regulator
VAFPTKLLPPPLRKIFEKDHIQPVQAEKTVLVVSDDPEVKRELRYAWPADIDLEVADDATPAWDRLKAITPGLVIVSIRTGNAGGFALTRDMSMVPRLAEVPVLMLLEREQDTWLAKEGGATKVRVAPFEASDLVADALDLLNA